MDELDEDTGGLELEDVVELDETTGGLEFDDVTELDEATGGLELEDVTELNEATGGLELEDELEGLEELDETTGFFELEDELDETTSGSELVELVVLEIIGSTGGSLTSSEDVSDEPLVSTDEVLSSGEDDAPPELLDVTDGLLASS